MKFLALLFLAGVALSAAFPLSNESDVSFPFEDFEDFIFQAEDDANTELGRDLKQRLDVLLEKIRYHLEEGYGFTEDYVYQAKVIVRKLEELKIDLGQQRKETIAKLKELSKSHWQRVIDRLMKETSLYAADDTLTELGNILKKRLDELLDKIYDALENGKGISEKNIEKVKEIREKMKDLKVDLGERSRELIEKIKEKAKDYWQKILDKLRPQESSFFDNDDIKTELGKKLKEHFDQMLEKFKDAIENGKTVKEDTIVKLKEIRDKLKDLKVDLGDRAKELITQLKEKAKDYWQKILDKIGGAKEKRELSHADFNILEYIKKLKNLLKEKLDADQLKEKVEQLFGKGSEFANQLINMLKEKGEKGKGKILDWIDRVLGDKETRSIKDVFEKVKNYFKDLGIELKEKFVKFGEWAKEQYEKGLEKGKTKADNIKKIAEEFIRDYKKVSKDVAEEALEFFREYKDDLGRVFDDLKDKVKEVVNKDN